VRHGVPSGGSVNTDSQPEAAGNGGNRILGAGGRVACILCMECIGTRDDLQHHLLTVISCRYSFKVVEV